MLRVLKSVFLVSFCMTIVAVYGQISQKGIPVSFKLENLITEIPVVNIPGPDVETLINENNTGKTNQPNRFAVLLPVKINFENSGIWDTLPNGDKLWRVKIKSKNAQALGLYFDKFKLPEGAKLFIYDNSNEQVKGAYTSKNNRSHGKFAIELVKGDVVFLELLLPYHQGNLSLQINELAYAFKSINQVSEYKGFGSSDHCEVNINCSPEGDNWQVEKKSVVRLAIKISGSLVWCSGTLLNNTKYNMIPYVLTADHCAYLGGYADENDLSQWLFYFNYESTNCEDPIQEPEHYSILGATKVASGGNKGSTGSDFYLLLLENNIPSSWDVYYCGWSAIDQASDQGVTIHHPEGDIKKISAYTETVTTYDFLSNGILSHWKVYWVETDHDWGVTEPGSSGAPLFDQEGRVIGSLTAGWAACDPTGNYGPDKPDFYGKFSYHWESNGDVDSLQLKPWLDSKNTGELILDGTSVGIKTNLIDNQSKINIYPIPANDYIFINFSNFDRVKVQLTIINVIGNIVKESHLGEFTTDQKVDISDLPSGLYFVKIEQKSNVMVKRMIKQ